ncbi:drop dead [Carabus blaptoides fortunei]
MGCDAFKHLCVIFLVILVTAYGACAFRLIRTTGDTKKDPEVTTGPKEPVRKVSSLKDEFIAEHYKEKYKNQTVNFHIKSNKVDDDDETDNEDSDEHETTKHAEKRLKIVLPLNMTKGMHGGVKDGKTDKFSLKEKSDDDEDDSSEKRDVKVKKDKLDKEKITKIHERRVEAKQAKQVEIKLNEELVKDKKGLDKEKIAKIHEKRIEAKKGNSKHIEEEVKEESVKGLDKEKIAKVHEKRKEAKEGKSKHIETDPEEEPTKDKKELDKEKIAKIHEKRVEAKEVKAKHIEMEVKDEPIKDKKGLDKEKIAKIHEKRIEAKEGKTEHPAMEVKEEPVKDRKEEKAKHAEIKSKEKTDEPIKEKKTVDKEKIAKIHEKHTEAKEEKKIKLIEKVGKKSKEPEKPEKKLDRIIEKTVPKVEKKIELDKPKEKKVLEKKVEILKTVEKPKPSPEDKKQAETNEKKMIEDKKSPDAKDKKQIVKENIKTKVEKPPVIKENPIPERKLVPKDQPMPKQISTPRELAKEIKPTTVVENVETRIFIEDNSESNILYYNLPSFSPNFESLQNEECKKQGHILLEQLNLRKLWALKMFDSTAKIPSGILNGNLNQFGDYDECMGIFVKIPTTDIRISGKYCLANIDFEAEIHEMKLSVHLAQGRSLIRSKLRDPGHFIPRFTTIRWGICIPSGCTAQDAEQIIEESIRVYNESSLVGVNFDVSVESDQCYVRKVSKKMFDYHYTTLATLCIFATVVLFVIISSIRDLKIIKTDEIKTDIQETTKVDQMLMSFSLKRTLGTLLKRETEPDEIKCIHGIRTICTFALYIAHKLIPIGHLPFTNKVSLTEISNNPLSVILRLSIIYTDSFLLLSGVLTAYGMSKDMEVKGRIPWFNRMVARFIRITPSLVFVLLYYAYIMDIIGEGPLWNTVITPNADLCKDYWWRNLLFIQNIYPFQDMCATHTHQLALDMQLSLVAPILVWLLYRRPLVGVFVTILLHIVSLVLRYYATINYRLSLVIYHGISISQLYRTANMMYASSIHRATPYIAGVGLGVLLRQMKPNFSIHKVLAIFGWLVAGYFASWTLYTPAHLSSRMYIYNVDEAAQHSALCSLAWALALSWMIFACCGDNKGYLNSLLSSHPMVLLSRISYTVYLTQFMVFFYNVGTVRSTAEFKINTTLDLSEIIIVIIISTILTLFVDIPAQKIKGILLKSTPAVKESPGNSNNIAQTTNQKVNETIASKRSFEEENDPISEAYDDNPISDAIDDEYSHNLEEDYITDDDLQKLDFEEIGNEQ